MVISLAKTQGVNRLVVVINKMDDPTVEWSGMFNCYSFLWYSALLLDKPNTDAALVEARYKECTEKLASFLKGGKSITIVLHRDEIS